MSQLIPYLQRSIGSKTIETVDARDLHAFLEIGKDYTSWIKAQIRRAQLIENEDFIWFTQKGESNGVRGGDRRSKECFLTFDAAKHVSMMSGSAKGREAREYFIACEKALQAQPESEGSVLVRLAIAYERQEALQRQMTQDMLALQAQTIATQAKTIEAHELATRALEAQLWMTLRQYRYVNNLQRQLSDADLKAFATYLSGYCLENGIPVAAEPVADRVWGKENKYHVPTIAELLPGWLSRRDSQEQLH